MSQPAIAPATDEAVRRHVAEFVEQGYTILPAAHDAEWVRAMRAAFERIRARQPTAGGEKPIWLEHLLELEPDLVLPAITRERVLAVAEGLIGPHVQIESMTFAGLPPLPSPAPADLPELPGWHRDLFALFPSGGYQRPWLFNAMSYLQDLTDANGPLHVIAGSHRRAVTIDERDKPRRHAEQRVLYPRAGDVVLFHHALLHTGGHNRSDETRFFVCTAYNHCWLKFRANWRGPACQAIIAHARARGDRRLLRLLGADDERVLHRALHDHVLTPEEGTWARWLAEERAAASAD
jgi:ectoine hydroxylase-related dioxygenase (phytanoyl-CoA dioxygenase family)